MAIMTVYTVEHQYPQYHRENVNGWFQSQLRIGVMGGHRTESDEFKEWKSRCIGWVLVQPEPLDDKHLIPRRYAYFENECDLFNYLLTFDEVPKIQPTGDVAMFYAPYIPLTVTSTSNYGNITPVTVTTTCDLNPGPLYGTGDGDGSI